MDIKPITNKKEYDDSLVAIDKLMSQNPQPDSTEAKNIILLSVLVERYEKDRFKFEKPTPVEAILFRMEEQGLDRSDLLPYIGNKSKVSEILSGKRPLSLNMIKALSKGLDISADILLSDDDIPAENLTIDLSKLPAKEMLSRGWIKTNNASSLQQFIAPVLNLSSQMLFRRSNNSEGYEGLLVAWLSRILNVSYKTVPANKGSFRKEFITKSFLKEVANLSYLDKGPLLAVELLSKNGILLIVEKYLSGLKVDGVALLREDGLPVIALSLRHDRLDSFWFTLLHELAHVFKHLSSEHFIFCDDLDETDYVDVLEKEADFLAKDSFIPLNIWKNSSALKDRSEQSVLNLSQRLRIHPSIVAGRLQREIKNYKIMRSFLGEGSVRKMFGA